MTLSDDAKAILGGMMGFLGIPGKSKIAFGMKKSRPTERAQRAFDELVSEGALSKVATDDGGVEYTVQVDCSPYGKWIAKNKSKGKFPVTEPIA